MACFNSHLFFLQPNTQSKPQKEGSEAEQFLGGKSEYPSQKLAREGESDPHLFSCIFSKGWENDRCGFEIC